ncbi:DNA repair exonuclease SbcCD nuclease subunit [Kroppenstedtia eburnea]|uniref:DNA repair exonuclease SbcCD nuclease subunit n=2 Tax=Kroppenstedtia eburnea TaxID=714067 RepID=A0A1N7KJF9_9BACL|nr:DNA repair exonuclease SbcCD nuclease subunit [Kroppenstedtia eburnea]
MGKPVKVIQMKSFTFVHTADLHLDLPFQGWKGKEGQGWARRQEQRRTFETIIGLVKERNAAFLLIAGDFLEHETASRSTAQWVIEQIRQIPGTCVLIAPGNHDPLRSDSFYKTLDWPSHVHIFDSEWEELRYGEFSLRVYGKGFADYEEPESCLPAVPPLEEGERRIMLVHGTYSSHRTESPYFPLCDQDLLPLELDYAALGHIHLPSLHRLDNRRGTWICYPGSPESLRWKETGERTVTVGTFGMDGLHLERIAVQTRRYEVDQVDVQGCGTEDQVIRRILEKFPPGEERQACRRIHLCGRRPVDLSLQEEWILSQLEDAGFHYVEVEDETLPDYDLDQIREQEGLAGLFVRKMEERIDGADPGEADLLRQALYKGLDALMVEGSRS